MIIIDCPEVNSVFGDLINEISNYLIRHVAPLDKPTCTERKIISEVVEGNWWLITTDVNYNTLTITVMPEIVETYLALKFNGYGQTSNS